MKGIWGKIGTPARQYWENGKADFPVYDMHGHMGPHNAIYFHRCEPEQMAEHLRLAGVKRLCFSHHMALSGAIRNAEVCEICRRYPDLFRMYVSINPNRPDFIREDLKLYDTWRPWAVGLKILPSYHGVNLEDPKYQYALDFAEERGLPVLCHTWGGSGACEGANVFKILERYHNLKLFLAHCIYGEWDNAFRCVNDFAGNVWLDLTCIPGERGTIETILKHVPATKILFGTDLPWFDEFQAIAGVLSARISDEDKKKILCSNAEDILGKDF